MTWYEEIIMTWFHIIFGVGLLGIIFVCVDWIIKWHRSIENQIENEREKNGR